MAPPFFLKLNVSGYNDKLLLLVDKIAQMMKTLKVDNDRFAAIKEEIGLIYKNWELEQPYQQVE